MLQMTIVLRWQLLNIETLIWSWYSSEGDTTLKQLVINFPFIKNLIHGQFAVSFINSLFDPPCDKQIKVRANAARQAFPPPSHQEQNDKPISLESARLSGRVVLSVKVCLIWTDTFQNHCYRTVWAQPPPPPPQNVYRGSPPLRLTCTVPYINGSWIWHHITRLLLFSLQEEHCSGAVFGSFTRQRGARPEEGCRWGAGAHTASTTGLPLGVSAPGSFPVLKMHLSIYRPEKVKYEWQPTVNSLCTHTHTHIPVHRLAGPAAPEHLEHKVINERDVTALLDKLHKDRTWRRAQNKLGHICMHFAPVLHLMTPKLSTVWLLPGDKTSQHLLCIQYNIILYLVLLLNVACSRPEQNMYTKHLQGASSPRSLLRFPSCSSPLLRSEQSQGDGGDDGQTNHGVAGAVDLWDFEAFPGVPQLI